MDTTEKSDPSSDVNISDMNALGNETSEIVSKHGDEEVIDKVESFHASTSVDCGLGKTSSHENLSSTKNVVVMSAAENDCDDNDDENNDDNNGANGKTIDIEVISQRINPLITEKSSGNIVKSTLSRIKFSKDPTNTINSILDTLLAMFNTNENEQENIKALLLSGENMLRMHSSNVKLIGNAIFTRVGLIAKSTRPENIAERLQKVTRLKQSDGYKGSTSASSKLLGGSLSCTTSTIMEPSDQKHVEFIVMFLDKISKMSKTGAQFCEKLLRDQEGSANPLPLF